MLFGFATQDEYAAAAAQVVYAVYRSRDKRKGPSGIDMWAKIERFARASAKRADGIGDFLESFKRRMACDTINPKWMQTGIIHANTIVRETGEIIQFNQPRRDFMVEIIEGPKEAQESVLDVLYHNTQRVILLVRDRIEREKPIELQLEKGAEISE